MITLCVIFGIFLVFSIALNVLLWKRAVHYREQLRIVAGAQKWDTVLSLLGSVVGGVVAWYVIRNRSK